MYSIKVFFTICRFVDTGLSIKDLLRWVIAIKAIILSFGLEGEGGAGVGVEVGEREEGAGDGDFAGEEVGRGEVGGTGGEEAVEGGESGSVHRVGVVEVAGVGVEETAFVSCLVTCFECPKVGGEEQGDALEGVVVAERGYAAAVAELLVPAVEADAFPSERSPEEGAVAPAYLLRHGVLQRVGVYGRVAAHI